VSTEEPFKKLVHVGLINAEDGRKMSKRWNNVINPDDVISEFGADAMRMYEMFMGPFMQSISWSTSGVRGVRRFLDKVWNLQNKLGKKGGESIEILLHKTIKKVTLDIENFNFNTAISAMMILVNEMEKETELSSADYELLITILSPFAPHITEDIWQGRLEKKDSIFNQVWPQYNEGKIIDKEIEMVVQINGKVRSKMKVATDISEDDAKQIALADEKIKSFIEGKEIRKIVFVKGRLLNLVVG